MNKLLKVILIESAILAGIYLAKAYGKQLDEFLKKATGDEPEKNKDTKGSGVKTAEKPASPTTTTAKESPVAPTGDKNTEKSVTKKAPTKPKATKVEPTVKVKEGNSVDEKPNTKTSPKKAPAKPKATKPTADATVKAKKPATKPKKKKED